MGNRGDKIKTRWYSERLQREVTLVRWGSVGQPILLFPTAGGDAEEVERFQMMDVLAPLLDAGKIKIYSCDSVAGRALLEREKNPRHQMWLQNMFHYYVRHEVVPAIRMDCKSEDIPIWSAGASIGAFHAAAVVCRFPDVFDKAICMSGTYDLRRFFDAREFSDDFWVSSPLHFVPTLQGRHLDVLRERYIHIVSGEGRAEDISESWNLANVLGRQGIPNRVDSWGPEWHHDWVTWRRMLPQILDAWTRGREGK
ncbi:MAG TPA: alpha/beta hydrolase-fold protein [Kofleriaceae bacterium]|nr:alpha/beta hydrolase-fold protein [Kofleriaceae bacterium]